MRELVHRFKYLFHRGRFDSDLEEELRDHLSRKQDEGATASEARRQFGNITSILEESRDMWRFTFIEQLGQDVRYALRSMAANRLFTLMVVTSLALGIGANTAIYSFMDAILVRALPVHNPEELVVLNWRAKTYPPVVHSHWGQDYDEPGGGTASPNFPYSVLRLFGDQSTVFSTLFGYVGSDNLNVVASDGAQIAHGQFTTGGYFSGLRISPAAGRLIGPDDDRPGAPPVAVLAFDYWQSRFAGDPAVVGKSVKINGTPVTIAGVAAPEFRGVLPQANPNVFLPMAQLALGRSQQDDGIFTSDTYYWIELMGRLKPGVTLAAAESQLAPMFHNFVASTATKDRERAALPALWLQPGGSGVDNLRRRFSKPLWILMTMVALILLIACANIANLLLARASSRRREIAVRLGLGAGRLRLVRQLLTETLLYSVAGGLAGLGVAALGIRFLIPLLTSGNDSLDLHVRLDWPVLAFTLLLTVITGMLFGLIPALQATRIDVTPALKETRASNPRSRTRHWGVSFGLSQILVVLQIAISLVLVVAAGLFIRTLANLQAVNLGFNARSVLLFHIDANKAGYKDAALRRFYYDVETRLASLPGVSGATSTDMPMVADYGGRTSISVPGIPEPPEGQLGPNTCYMMVGPTFFDTMEIPILAGRALGKGDVEGAPHAVVVNQVFVDTYMKGQNPIGRHFTLGTRGPNKLDLEIVGVARTARYNSLKREVPPVTYLSWLQDQKGRRLQEMYYEVRTVGDPLALANSVRQIVRDASPLVPVQGLTTQTQRIESTISQERGFAKLCSCFGALALLMACVGLYGTMAYNVARRTNEVGIRMALGADRGRIVWMVLREVLVMCVLGSVIGLIGVSQTTTVVKSFLFNVKPADPVALSLSAVVLFACAVLAGLLPARRAASINPVDALRAE